VVPVAAAARAAVVAISKSRGIPSWLTFLTPDIQDQINTLSDHTFGQWWDSIQVPDLVSPTFDFSNYDFAGPGTQGSLLNDVFNSIPVNIPVFTGGGGGGGGDYVGSGDYFGDVGFSSEEGL
jgi:hypothetical protein